MIYDLLLIYAPKHHKYACMCTCTYICICKCMVHNTLVPLVKPINLGAKPLQTQSPGCVCSTHQDLRDERWWVGPVTCNVWPKFGRAFRAPRSEER